MLFVHPDIFLQLYIQQLQTPRPVNVSTRITKLLLVFFSSSLIYSIVFISPFLVAILNSEEINDDFHLKSEELMCPTRTHLSMNTSSQGAQLHKKHNFRLIINNINKDTLNLWDSCGFGWVMKVVRIEYVESI